MSDETIKGTTLAGVLCLVVSCLLAAPASAQSPEPVVLVSLDVSLEQLQPELQAVLISCSLRDEADKIVALGFRTLAVSGINVPEDMDSSPAGPIFTGSFGRNWRDQVDVPVFGQDDAGGEGGIWTHGECSMALSPRGTSLSGIKGLLAPTVCEGDFTNRRPPVNCVDGPDAFYKAFFEFTRR